MSNNLMTRSFTPREKILLTILTVLLIGGCYYLLVVKNVADTQLSNATQMAEVETEIQVQSSVVAARTQMAEALKKLGPTDKLPEVAVYDNLRNEIDAINTALAGATTNNLSYGQPELDGTLVRRPVTLSFTVGSTAEAISVMKQLQGGKYACEIPDFSLTNALKTDGGVSSTSVTMSIVYFETTTGSVNLNGLVEKAPATTATTN